MTAPIPVLILASGRTYPSITAAAEALGITAQALSQYLRREAAGLRPPGRPPGHHGTCSLCSLPGHTRRSPLYHPAAKVRP